MLVVVHAKYANFYDILDLINFRDVDVLKNYNQLLSQVIHVYNLNDGGIRIYVKLPIGEIITLVVVPNDTVNSVKTKIQHINGISPDQQQLTFTGTQLEDCHALSTYNIHNGSMLDLQLCGGEYTCMLICVYL